jgi:prevent-host-death family protein
MREEVGIRELRQNLSVYLRRVAQGERFIVTDHNRPVASLGPVLDAAGRDEAGELRNWRGETWEEVKARLRIQPAKYPSRTLLDLPPLWKHQPGEPTLTDIILQMRDDERY